MLNFCKIYLHCQGGYVGNHKNCLFYKKNHPSCQCKYRHIRDGYCQNNEAIVFTLKNVINSIINNKQFYINDNLSIILTKEEIDHDTK